MKIHEYQAKALFKSYNIPIPNGHLARTSEEALQGAISIGTFPVVLKAQIHAGGRGMGGGATSEMVKHGLKTLLSDKDVEVIFINIFGGILRCDTLALGVVEAAKELKIDLPVVIRLEGTNVNRGREILAESGLTFTVASSLKEAAEKVAVILKQVDSKQ